MDDAQAAYCWVMEHGYSAPSIGWSGISAGATIVTQLACPCHQERLPMPGAAVVMSGLLNFEFKGNSFEYNADRDIVYSRQLSLPI